MLGTFYQLLVQTKLFLCMVTRNITSNREINQIYMLGNSFNVTMRKKKGGFCIIAIFYNSFCSQSYSDRPFVWTLRSKSKTKSISKGLHLEMSLRAMHFSWGFLLYLFELFCFPRYFYCSCW